MTIPTTFPLRTDSAALPPRAARRGLAGLGLSVLLSALGTSIANVALPTFAVAFDAPFTTVQWIVLAYLLTVTSFLVGAGRLGDLVGRRRLLILGLAVFTGAAGMAAAAPSLVVLVIARALQGLGAAVMLAHTVALVGGLVSPARVGGAMGLLGTMSAVGTALGPSLGGALVAALGWRAIFLVQVPLGIAALLLVGRGLPAEHRAAFRAKASMDPLGTLLLAGSLAAYAMAVTDRGGLGGPRALTSFAVATGAALLFVAVERRVASPLLRPAMFRDANLTIGLVLSLLVSSVVMATLVVGPFHLSRGLGLDAVRVGAVLTVGPLVAAFVGVPAGRLVDRLGAPATTVVGLAVMACGALLLAVLPTGAGVAGYAAPVGVLTGGYAVFQTANNTAVMVGTCPEQRGLVSGVLNLSRHLGLVTGVSLLGAVFVAAVGGGDPATVAPPGVADGMRTTFAVGAVLLVAALAVALGRTRSPRAPRESTPCPGQP